MASITLNGHWYSVTNVTTAAFVDNTNDTAFVITDNVLFLNADVIYDSIWYHSKW